MLDTGSEAWESTFESLNRLQMQIYAYGDFKLWGNGENVFVGQDRYQHGAGDNCLSTQKPRFFASKIASASSARLITLDIQHFGCWCSDTYYND